MNVRMLFLTAAVTLGSAVALAAPAVAQDYNGWERPSYQANYRPDYAPPPPPGQGFDRGQHDVGIRDREQRLADWMRRGADEGWLNGWQAHRAFSTLIRIRRQDQHLCRVNGGALSGEQQFALNQQLDYPGDFVRQAQTDGGEQRW